MQRLKDKLVIVTGGASGMGAATARLFEDQQRLKSETNDYYGLK